MILVSAKKTKIPHTLQEDVTTSQMTFLPIHFPLPTPGETIGRWSSRSGTGGELEVLRGAFKVMWLSHVFLCYFVQFCATNQLPHFFSITLSLSKMSFVTPNQCPFDHKIRVAVSPETGGAGPIYPVQIAHSNSTPAWSVRTIYVRLIYSYFLCLLINMFILKSSSVACVRYVCDIHLYMIQFVHLLASAIMCVLQHDSRTLFFSFVVHKI